jgi:hypothetical protein
MMRTMTGDPITLGPVVPADMCQPPVKPRELIKQLSREELERLANTMAVWAPEAFERGLQRVSEVRAEMDSSAKQVLPCHG